MDDGRDLQSYVRDKIASGEFHSAEEFAEEAIRVYRDLESGHRALREAIQQRIAESSASDSDPLDIQSIKDELSEQLNDDGTPK